MYGVIHPEGPEKNIKTLEMKSGRYIALNTRCCEYKISEKKKLDPSRATKPK